MIARLAPDPADSYPWQTRLEGLGLHVGDVVVSVDEAEEQVAAERGLAARVRWCGRWQ